MIKKGFLWLLLFAPGLLACSMEPDGLDEAESQLVSISSKDPNTSFSAFTTFAITDSIYVIKDTKKDSYREKNAKTDMVIQQIKQNMLDAGYQLVALGGETDLLVDVSYLQVTNTSVLYPGYWWAWSYFDFWWDWGPWYPYYPYPVYPVVSSYTVGSLMIETAAVQQVDDEGKVPVVWTGYIRGILYNERPQSEVTSAIDECFSQIPPK